MVKFLTEVLNTEKFPLTVMDRPLESETPRRRTATATILAFLHEWSLFAERTARPIKVVNAIKMRPTHSNMIFLAPARRLLPAQGRGLGMWAYKHRWL